MIKRLFFILILSFLLNGGCVTNSQPIVPSSVSEKVKIEYLDVEFTSEVTTIKITKNPLVNSSLVKVFYDNILYGMYSFDDTIFLPKREVKNKTLILLFLNKDGKLLSSKSFTIPGRAL